MVIKVLYAALVLSIAALVAVAVAVYLRVRRHLDGKVVETEAHAPANAPVRDVSSTPPEEG